MFNLGSGWKCEPGFGDLLRLIGDASVSARPYRSKGVAGIRRTNPAIKLIHEMQNFHRPTSCIAEYFRSLRPPKTKTPRSSRAGEGSRRVHIVSIMLSDFSICFHGINRNARLAVLVGAAGWRVSRFRSPQNNLIRRDLCCLHFGPGTSETLLTSAEQQTTAGLRKAQSPSCIPCGAHRSPSAATNRVLFEKWRLP
jgi:hypothetical protein